MATTNLRVVFSSVWTGTSNVLTRRRASIILLLLLITAALCLTVALGCGSSGCFSSTAEVVWGLRLPRALSAFSVGGLLALAGALMQVLLRNPLADPYILGVSGGAAVGAMLALLLAPAAFIVTSTHIGALGGAILSIALLFGLAREAVLWSDATNSGIRLVLTGVMIAAGFGACITLMLSVAPDGRLRGMIFWLMGDLENSALYAPACVLLLLTTLWSINNAPRLNILVHGDVAARILGIPVQRLRLQALLIASVATAAAVATAGTIGFVGLVVPHALRLVFGNDQRLLLPACALCGGSALLLADLLARTVVAPVQLPVGVITALIGVPLFLHLLKTRRR